MTDSAGKELQAKQKTEVSTPAEQTTPGVVFVPAVDIFESEKDITLLADLPGVKSEDLKIDLRDNVLTLSGDIAPYDRIQNTCYQDHFQIRLTGSNPAHHLQTRYTRETHICDHEIEFL